MPDTEFKVSINPLLMIWLLPEEELPTNVPHDAMSLTCRFVGQPWNEEFPLQNLRDRNEEMSACAKEPFVLPAFQLMMQNIVRPLVEAKRCYILGMPVPCIAQSGLVGEMVALWRFEMLEMKLGARPLDEKLQKLLLGKPFEKLGQDARVRVLRAVEELDEDTVQAFGALREIRRRYLHFMVPEGADLDADARAAFAHARLLVNKTLGLTIKKGKVLLPPKVLGWMQRLAREPAGESAGTGEDA